MEILEIKDKYDNVRTYENIRSKLKRVNNLLCLEPVEVIHTNEYVNSFSKMVDMLTVQLKTKEELIAFMGGIAGAVSRSLPFGKINPLSKLIVQIKKTDMPVQVLQTDATPWIDNLKKFDKIISEHPNLYAKIVATCYKHGYTLKIGEIFNTTTVKTEGFSFLDFDNKEWNIGKRKFTVTKEFADALRPLLSDACPLLIFKSTLQPYTIQTHAVLDLDDFSNTDIRNSYTDFVWYHSQLSVSEKISITKQILGHSELTSMAYYKSNPAEPISLKQRIAEWKSGDPKIKVVIRRKTTTS